MLTGIDAMLLSDKQYTRYVSSIKLYVCVCVRVEVTVHHTRGQKAQVRI